MAVSKRAKQWTCICASSALFPIWNRLAEPLRRIPAWLAVIAYFVLAESIFLAFGSFGDNVPSVIAWTLHLSLAIAFVVAASRARRLSRLAPLTGPRDIP
jgi:hypothetical protein